jgi:type VI secretion system secreted protein VgrG
MHGVGKEESQATQRNAPEHVLKFIEFAAKGADAVEAQFAIPAPVVIAQAALETGWGTHVKGNAYFGIKGIADSGKSVTAVTHEFENGKRTQVIDEFRAYNNFEEAAIDYGRFLSTNPRYAKAFDFSDDPLRFADEVARAGYATDPEYASKLKSILRKYVIPSMSTE